jgi:prephenate dehydrogenase
LSAPPGIEAPDYGGEISEIRRVSVFGPGLIGGSVAMAIKSRCPHLHLTIWGRNPASLKEIRRLNLADSVENDASKAAADADLVILCTPVGSLEAIAATIAPHLRSDAVVTDAGSVKGCVVQRLEPLLGSRFVGAHPMAGSEKSGISAARADLFAGAPCILTPEASTDPRALRLVGALWTTLGSRLSIMAPAEHDRIVARVSHLPHALAFGLVNLVTDTLPEGSQNLAGGSYRDATRVAASDPALWTGILTENCTEVAAALRDMANLLQAMASELGKENPNSLLDFLKRGKEHGASLRFPPPEENTYSTRNHS